jgi:RNA polymerase sigma-54 factor
MKQSLQLKLGQQLTMTPQLQQAIRLLQLSTLDLQQEIQQTLDSNPLLEVSEDEVEGNPEAGSPEAQASHEEQPVTRDGPLENLEAQATDVEAQGDWEENLPEELPVDTQWEDALPSASSSAPAPSNASADVDFESRNSAGASLQESLLWQLNLTRLSSLDKAIAVAIIDATDTDGRLTLSIEEIHDYLAISGEGDLDIDIDEVVAVLHCVQQFEPVGVCTQDLQECLLVQLQQLPPDTPWIEQAFTP